MNNFILLLGGWFDGTRVAWDGGPYYRCIQKDSSGRVWEWEYIQSTQNRSHYIINQRYSHNDDKSYA